MNIKARINARKILLVYYYEQYFLDSAGRNIPLLAEIERVKEHMSKETDIEEVNLQEKMTKEYYQDTDEEIGYLFKNHFPNLEEKQLDWKYIEQIAGKFWNYEPIVRDKVDQHTVTF